MDDEPPPPEWEELREQLAKERVERVTARRALLQLVPGNLRDVDAAARCECSCHPQPGRDPHHGLRCMCQISERARRARWRATLKAFDAIGEQWRPVNEQHQSELAEAAADLGVEIREAVPGAPWVLTGLVDGRAFYLRERWDLYDIVIAPDQTPSAQPWNEPDLAGITIHSGDSGDLYVGTPPDYRVAVRFVVAVIREHLARAACPHPARPGDRYCPGCGAPLTDPAEPR